MSPRKQPDRMETFNFPPEPAGLQGGRCFFLPGVTITAFREERESGVLGADFATVHMYDPWRVTGTVRVEAARLVITRLTIEPQPSWQSPSGRILKQDEMDAVGNGVTSSLLRSIQVGRLISALRAELQRHPEAVARMAQALAALGADTPSVDPEYLDVARRVAQAVPGPPKRGPHGRGDDFYRQVALLYLELQSAGWGRGILGEIARLEDRPRETVSTWVRQARKRGFLTAGTPGRAGAEPGPRLHETPDGQGAGA
jgi:hypothetical protein